MTEEPKSIHDRIVAARRETGDGRTAFEARGDAPVPRRGWGRTLLYTVAGIVLIGGAGIGVYQFPVFAESAAQASGKKAQPEQQLAGAGASDPFLTHATQAGANACAATYAELGKALADGTQFMVQTQTAKADVDRHALQGVVGMAFRSSKDGEYTGPAAGLVFAAPTSQGCEGTMVRIVPFAQSCQAAAAFLPKGSQQQQPLSGLPVFALSTGGQAMLMPAGTGCIAISIVRSGGA